MPVLAVAIVAVVVVAAFARFAPAAAAARQRDELIARCTEIQARLQAARVQGGDPARADAIERELASCVQQANALGAGIDESAVRLTEADNAYQQIEEEWRHFKSTDYVDWLTRKNTRNTMLRVAGGMINSYGEATALAKTPEAAARIRASILRSLEAAIQRRNCYATKAAGCDRSGPAESTAEEKAQEELDRVIRPLADAYRANEAALVSLGGGPKTWGVGSDTYGNRDFGSTLLLDCERMADYVRSKFAELQSVGYSDDPERRKNIRADLIAWERAMVACARNAMESAIADRSEIGLGAVIRFAGKAREDSIARRTCFATGASGCGRFGFTEADEATKARDEEAVATTPLGAIINEATVARAQIASGRISSYRAVSRAARDRLIIGRIG